MTRSEILKRADEIINGQREQDYGSAERNFGLIGQLWTVYLDHLVTAQDVANMMTLFKIARIKTGRGTEDSYIDAVGYMACGGEIATEDADEKPTNYLEKATAGMRPKYIKFLKTQIEEQTKDKHIPAGINNRPFVPSYPPEAGVKCCCTDKASVDEDIAQIVAENERKWELLRAIFGNADKADEPHDSWEDAKKVLCERVARRMNEEFQKEYENKDLIWEKYDLKVLARKLRDMSDLLYQYANRLKKEEDEDDED